MTERSMSEFWDARAAEDPYFFVDNRLRYGEPADLDHFWEGGAEALDLLNARLGLVLASGEEVVEIGCGVGRITRALAERCASVRALDVSPRMLSLARELNPDLANVEWILGDGRSLAGIESASADGCHSFVVFQHIPEPEITLGYVREIGRVLRAGGWAAFQFSDLPEVHLPPIGARVAGRLRAALGRGPHGQNHPAWLGSAVALERIRAVGVEAGLEIERVLGEGSQYCAVLMRRG